MATKEVNKQLPQQFSGLDNDVFSAFCDTFKGVEWTADFKDGSDVFSGIDLQLTGTTSKKVETYDVELKSSTLHKFLPYFFFEPSKWLDLVGFDNNKKLYVAIYIYQNKIVVWNVTGNLLRRSEKTITSMNRNTSRGSEKVDKTVYKLKVADGKVFDFDLSEYLLKYNALHNKTGNKEG